MNRRLPSLLFVCLLMLTAFSSGCTDALRIDNDDDKPGMRIISFNETHAFDHEQALYDMGPRTAGTDEELDGAIYVSDQFTEAGLHNVHIEEFEKLMYEVNDASLDADAFTDDIVIDESYTHMRDFMVLGYSGSTSGDEEYDVVYVENGTDEAYAQAGNVAGQAVLVINDNSFGTAQIYMQAINHSAAAVMQFNPGRAAPISKTAAFATPGGVLVPLPEMFPDADLIPYMMLSADAGEDLRTAAESVDSGLEYCTVTVDFDVDIEDRISYNTVGDIKGSGSGLVIIGAHMDTVYCGRGGIDNTVGTAIVTELAFSLAQYHPEKTIRLITFGSEEVGLFGSQEYVAAHLDELQKELVFMMNLDMTEIDLDHGNALPLCPSTEKHLNGLNKTAQKFFDEYPDLGENYTVNLRVEPGTVGSDHRPFYLEGFDVMAGWGNHGEGYHTPDDVIENVNPQSWPVVGGVIGSYALYLASN